MYKVFRSLGKQNNNQEERKIWAWWGKIPKFVTILKQSIGDIVDFYGLIMFVHMPPWVQMYLEIG